MKQKAETNKIYLVIYIIGCILSLGTLWFAREFITHAIVEAQNKTE